MPTPGTHRYYLFIYLFIYHNIIINYFFFRHANEDEREAAISREREESERRAAQRLRTIEGGNVYSQIDDEQQSEEDSETD
jgi:hypothetical protein